MNATPEQQAALIAAGISPALVGLVEFVEEDGSPVAVCDPECGVIAITEDEEGWHSAEWYVGWCSALTPRMGGRRYQYCPQCGSIVGYLPDARPFRIRHSRVLEALEQAQAERDHLRRALEWTIATMQGADKYECPRPCPEGQHDEDGRCIGTREGCWNITALAATEEAPDE